MTSLRRLVIPAAHFDALARGYGDEAAMRTLRDGQISFRRLLFRQLLDDLRGAARGLPEADRIDAAVTVLIAADAHDGGATNSVMISPHVRVWLERSRRRLPAGLSETTTGFVLLAAAVAICSGIDFSLEFTTVQDSIHLPALGSLTGLDPGTVVISGSADGFRCGPVTVTRPFSLVGKGWYPLRRIGGGETPAIVLDDLDPHRDTYQWPPQTRLSDQDFGIVETKWTAAWDHIAVHYPEHAAAVGALHTLVPLAAAPGNLVSGASNSAYGAIALCLPEDTPRMVELIIHESQHVRLHGLLDLVDLYDRQASDRYYAAWRIDSRPIGPFLQGVYAHLGVCDFWRRHRHLATVADHSDAEYQFVLWRIQLTEALTALSASTELTDLGRRFVAGMAETVRGWSGEILPAELERLAADVALAHRLRWDEARTRESDLSGQLKVRFAAAARRWVAGHVETHDTDQLLARGDYGAAAEAYAARLALREDVDDRIGLNIAQGRLSKRSVWH